LESRRQNILQAQEFGIDEPHFRPVNAIAGGGGRMLSGCQDGQDWGKLEGYNF
jgi:hypothetical protein